VLLHVAVQVQARHVRHAAVRHLAEGTLRTSTHPRSEHDLLAG
jgi:hypothetical protein